MARARGRCELRALARRRRGHTRTVTRVTASWALLATLGVLVGIDDARPRLRGLAVRSAVGRPARHPRPARPRRRPRVGSRHPPLDGDARRAPRRARRRGQLALPHVAALGGDRAGRRSSARCSSSRPCSSRSGCATRPSPGTSRTTRRTRSRSPATSSSTATTPTGTTTAARASSASTRRRTTSEAAFDRGGAAPLRLLPRHGADGRRLAPTARARSTTTASSSCSRPSRCCRPRCSFPGALVVRLAVGAALAANPLIVHGAWFGTADAPALLALVLAFALLARGHLGLGRREPRRGARAEAVRARRPPVLRGHAADDARAAPDASTRPAPRSPESSSATVLPFLVADPGALWDDTVAYGADTYRIIGYGLAALLLNLGVDRRPLRLLPVRAARDPRSGCRSRRGCSGISGALGLLGPPLPVLRFRCSSCCS